MSWRIRVQVELGEGKVGCGDFWHHCEWWVGEDSGNEGAAVVEKGVERHFGEAMSF